MKYIEIDFDKVRGYGGLDIEDRELLERVYKIHNSGHGTDYKEGYIPISVTKADNNLKVTFRNGEWLYYFANGTWG